MNRIQEGNLLTEECVSTILSFTVALASKTLLHNIRQFFVTVSSNSVKLLLCEYIKLRKNAIV